MAITPTTQVTVLLCTCPNADAGRTLAATLLDEKLIACANIIDGVRSLYRWGGKLCDDTECLLIIKTIPAHVHRLTERIATLHPYDVPEVLALSTVDGHVPYLDWVAASVSPAPSDSSS